MTINGDPTICGPTGAPGTPLDIYATVGVDNELDVSCTSPTIATVPGLSSTGYLAVAFQPTNNDAVLSAITVCTGTHTSC
jgi:hypothetical protein